MSKKYIALLLFILCAVLQNNFAASFDSIACQDGLSKCLISAVQSKDRHAVMDLLREGADVNFHDSYGFSPLMYALFNNDVNMVNALLDANADLYFIDKSGKTVKDHCFGNEMIEKSINNKLKNAPQSDCFANDPYIKQLRLGGQQIKINKILIEASKKGNVALVRMLIKLGADPNSASLTNGSAIMRAIEKGHVEIVEVLLSAGANAYDFHVFGFTPLILAATIGNAEIVEVILNKDSSGIDFCNNEGSTALIEAASNGHLDVVELLIRRGATIELKNLLGLSAINCAEERGHFNVINKILSMFYCPQELQ